MKLFGFLVVVGGLLFPAIVAGADEFPLKPKAGDTYQITRINDSSGKGGNSNGSSHDKDTLIERVIEVRQDGLELEYDLPKTVSAAQRAGVWQFPVRVFKPSKGPAQLLNGPELEARIDAGLKAAGMPRSLCGHWYFTWNAFQVECDPQSVIKRVESFDLRPDDLHEGASYKEAEASAPGKLVKEEVGSDDMTFTAEMPVDPEVVRRARAESDVATGEIMRKPVTLEAALSNRSKDIISGTISVVFETDSAGNVRWRKRLTKLDIKGQDGQTETRTITETVERRLISEDK